MSDKVEIYWAARDLAGPPVGNHHFILIMLPKGYNFSTVSTQSEGENRFVTLGGYPTNATTGKLVFVPNNPDDVQSVKEFFNSSLRETFSDFDLEKNQIKYFNGSGSWDFANKLVDMAFNYNHNTKKHPVEYLLFQRNCTSWANSLLSAAGVSSFDRHLASGFTGVDVAEDVGIDSELFTSGLLTPEEMICQ